MQAARLAASTSAIALAVAACTGGDDEQAQHPSDRPSDQTGSQTGVLDVEVTGLAAEPGDDGQVALSWDAIDGIPAFNVAYADVTVEVPATICEETCTLTVKPEPAGQTHELMVSAVRDGAESEPAVTTAEVPTSAAPEIAENEPLEVVLVYAGEGGEVASPPEVERIPVGSEKEAKSVIHDAEAKALKGGDRKLLSANLSTPFVADSAPAIDGGATVLPWQLEALRYDLLPGDRPGEGVTVAVIEGEGLDASHPVFDGASILDGAHMREEAANGQDDPTDGHATMVASMIAGQPGSAVPGIAPGATIMPVNMGDGLGEYVQAMIWAVDNGADVINVSVSRKCADIGPVEFLCPDDIQAGTDYAEAHGVVVVASAGNNGDGGEFCDDPTNARKWPAVLDTVISVGGHDQNQEPWVCTPDRPDVDVLAPAAEMLQPALGGGYVIEHGGTSAASPLMAGLIAAILAERPDLTPADIRALLPQWRNANGSINVAAALVSVGILESDFPSTDDFENADHIYPYRADFVFADDHPMSVALPKTQDVKPEFVFTSDVGWSTHSIRTREQDGKVAFGEVEGLLLVDNDGTVTGSGALSYRHGPGFGYGITSTGEQIVATGHSYTCPKARSDYWKSFRWNIPVAISGTLVPGTEDNPEIEDLTFSFGIGATPEENGDLPSMIVTHDSMKNCGALLDAYAPTFESAYDDEFPSWGAYKDNFERFEKKMESIYEILVTSSPYTMTESVQPEYSQNKSEVADDSRVSIWFMDADRPRPSSFLY